MLQADHLAAAPEAAPEAPDRLLHDVVDRTPLRDRPAHGIAVGILAGFDSDGSALVDIAAFGLSGVRARSVAALDAGQLGQQVALGFEAADPGRPIVLGLMLTAAPPRTQAEALVDGEKVVLTATHEIELRCGEAAIVLSSDGRVQIRGTYITSHASATQRILGGSVNVN
jgi:hypothetical protein